MSFKDAHLNAQRQQQACIGLWEQNQPDERYHCGEEVGFNSGNIYDSESEITASTSRCDHIIGNTLEVLEKEVKVVFFSNIFL